MQVLYGKVEIQKLLLLKTNRPEWIMLSQKKKKNASVGCVEKDVRQ